MHLIEKEKKLLLEIAGKDFAQNDPKNFLRNDMDASDTYYLDRNTEEHAPSLTEYDFQTPVELKEILEKQWTDASERNMIPAVMVAAFKLQDHDAATEQVSEKIYNF